LTKRDKQTSNSREALRQYEALLPTGERMFGPEHLNTLTICNGLRIGAEIKARAAHWLLQTSKR
jgi:hypothetical protein